MASYLLEIFNVKDLAPESDQNQVAQDGAEVSIDSGSSLEDKCEKVKDKDERDKDKNKELDKEKGKEKDSEKKGESEKEKVKGIEGASLDALLQRLPGCVSRDLIDQLTVITVYSLHSCVHFFLFCKRIVLLSSEVYSLV